MSEAAHPPGVRWQRAFLMGIAAEIALMFVAVPLYFLPSPATTLQFAIPPASFLVLVPFGYWAARPVRGRYVLHGLLAGVGAVVFYVLLTFGVAFIPGAPPIDFATLFSPGYLLAHALKLAGGAVGGMLAERAARR